MHHLRIQLNAFNKRRHLAERFMKIKEFLEDTKFRRMNHHLVVHYLLENYDKENNK